MKKVWRPVLWIFAIGAVSGCIAIATPLSFWIVLAILAGSILVNGLFATVEDDLPGGFNNPDGKSPPTYVAVGGWIVRCLLLVAGTLLVVVLGLHFYGAR